MCRSAPRVEQGEPSPQISEYIEVDSKMHLVVKEAEEAPKLWVWVWVCDTFSASRASLWRGAVHASAMS